MKRNELTKQIEKRAKALGVAVVVKQGAEHEKWIVGGLLVTIPRHREIGPKMAFEIRRRLGEVLGKDWWR